MSTLDHFVAALLDDFYTKAGVDWRSALEGEKLEMTACVTETEGIVTSVRSVTFLADGVRQVVPPLPFDAIASAEALLTKIA
jgi:hypothetical protein